MVHNGIIDNYLEIKEFLISKSIKFKSETDSEVIVNLISYNYNQIYNFEIDENKRIEIITQLVNFYNSPTDAFEHLLARSMRIF